MSTQEEREAALDNAVAELLGHCSTKEEAEEALLNCFSSPILCLIAAAFKQGESQAIPAIIGNCANQALSAVKTCVMMHQTGQFDALEKENKH